MNEQKKDAALDEEALENVTGGAYGTGGVKDTKVCKGL